MFQGVMIFSGLIFPEEDKFYSWQLKILKNVVVFFRVSFGEFVSWCSFFAETQCIAGVGKALLCRDAMHCVFKSF